MIVAKIKVSGVRANTVYKNFIPAGIIGAQVDISYAEDIWQGIRKTVVFLGVVTKDVVTDASIVTIPPEVVAMPNSALSVGVYGVDADGNLAIPTIWADLGFVRDSANPSDDTTTDQTLPVWAQIQAIIGSKVDKVEGKGLSSNDYDNADKAKVDAIPEDPKYTDTVYDDTEVKQGLSQIKDDLSDLAPAGAAVGQLFRVASISEDGKYTMEPVDMLDVQISGTSVVTDGVANIPLGNSSKYGVAKFGSGLYVSNGNVSTNLAVASEISSRSVGRTIETSNIDIAVKAAMCDGKGSAWTAEEQAAARERMGIPGDYELIETFTLQEDSAWERTKEPNGNDYNFTSVFIYRLYPSRGSIHSSDYSHLYFYDFSGRALFADTGRTTDNRYNRTNISILERKGGISMVKYTKTVDIGASSDFLIRSLMGYGLDDQFGNVCKIKSYDPSGCVINIYGVRA